MGIRMSGLSSGMDTEAIVKELMSAQSMKKNKVVKAKTKLEWTQTKWSELNTKLTGLYNNFVSKMQLSTAYKTKKTTVSDATKASVAGAAGRI
jgi:flagellar hook-associated protein 2